MPLQDAARWYGVNEVTLYRLLRDRPGKPAELTRHKRKGDKRTWLVIDELERTLRPERVQPPADQPS
jgi:hypothetical protein